MEEKVISMWHLSPPSCSQIHGELLVTLTPEQSSLVIEFVCFLWLSALSDGRYLLLQSKFIAANNSSGERARNGQEGRPLRSNKRLKMLRPISYWEEHVVCNKRSVFTVTDSCH